MRKTILLLSLILALVAMPAWPQASTTTVRGTVTDQTNAVVPGASVTLTNTATNVTSQTTTNQVGLYVFPGVIPGSYLLTAEAAGMQKFEARITAQVGSPVLLNAVLKVGQTATEVSVQETTPLLNTDNPSLGHVLDRQRIEQLPINGRNLTNLLQTTPGMEGARAFGVRDGAHEFVLDGAALSDRVWGWSIMQRQPGLDSIQEFKVENNASSAKYTRPTTVILSTKNGTNQFHGTLFETNRNNGYGKARARQDTYTKAPQLNRNEYGGSAGGPVILPKIYNGKDRTFWFFSYEGQRYAASSTTQVAVPTAAMRAGDFSGLVDSQGRQYKIYDPLTTDPVTWSRQQFNYGGRANVIDPARLNPLAKYVYGITPLPTEPNVNPLLDNNWFGPGPNHRKGMTWVSRFDHRFTDKDNFYARLTQSGYDTSYWYASIPTLDQVSNFSRDHAPNESMALNWVHTISPTLFNEFMFSAARQEWAQATGEPGVKYADKLGLPNPFSVPGFPQLYNPGINLNYGTQNARNNALNYFILDNNATKIAGKHELQFGVHIRYDQLNILPDQQQNQGSHDWGSQATMLYDPVNSTPGKSVQGTNFTGHNLANMYLGVMNYSNQFVRSYFYVRTKEYAAYLQDNYRLSPRLTLNLGVRWEYWPAYTEKNNVMVGFDPKNKAIVLGNTLDEMYRIGAFIPSVVGVYQKQGIKFETWDQAGLPRNMMKGNKANFGPRVGFNYRMGDGAKSVVMRGGYALSYFPIPARPFTARMRNNTPLTARFGNYLWDVAKSPDGLGAWGMRSVPTIFAGVNSRDAITFDKPTGLYRGSAFTSYYAPDQPDSRVHTWNLTFEKEIASNMIARAGYVGNHGAALEQFYQYNNTASSYIWYVTRGTELPTGDFGQVLQQPFDQQALGFIEEYRKTGWSNYNGASFELERRFSRGLGWQLSYVVGNTLGAGGQEWYGTSVVPGANQFLPGAVSEDYDARNKFLNYQRDTSVPKHRVRWNWVADLPFGRGKLIGKNVGGMLDRVIGGWQIAGMGSLRNTYFSLPTTYYPNGNKIEIYGYKYPIQDCRSGACRPGYLWWNGYINPNQINSTDPKTGKPNGVMGVPAGYKPAGQPLHPWPVNPDKNNWEYQYYGGNTVWVPLKDGTLKRVGFNDNLHPWRQQYLPSVRDWGLDASAFKTIPIKESVALRFNADFFNVLNHPGNPNSVGEDGILSTRNSGVGAREIQLTLRLTW